MSSFNIHSVPNAKREKTRDQLRQFFPKTSKKKRVQTTVHITVGLGISGNRLKFAIRDIQGSNTSELRFPVVRVLAGRFLQGSEIP